MICDGASRDEMLFHYHGLIEQLGWSVVAVGDDRDWGNGWIYTVGLTALDHPELVIVGVPPDRCGPILANLAERVLEGEVLVPGDRLDVLGVDVDLVSVHPEHVADGLVTIAEEYYEALGWPTGSVDALQAVVPTGLAYCSQHEFDPPRLNDPAAWR